MTSSDGVCSTLTFTPGELGQTYTGEVPTAKHPMIGTSTAVSSSQNTPMATPTSVAPPSPFPPSNHHHRSSSSYSIAPSPPPAPLGPNMRPSSPTRSNSTSSIATQSSYAPGAQTGSVISNPPLVSGSLPTIAAGGGTVSFMTGMPMTTPPQTPRSTTSSVSGVKRDASESESGDKEEGPQGGEKKRRRIAPTPVGSESSAP
jgi:chromatin assembly factor 1 subunit B